MNAEQTRLIRIDANNSTDIIGRKDDANYKGVDYNFRDSTAYTQTAYLRCVEEVVISRPEEVVINRAENQDVIGQGTTQYITRLTIYNIPYSNLMFYHNLRDCDSVFVYFFPYNLVDEAPDVTTQMERVRPLSFSHQLDESGNFYTGTLELELFRSYRSQCEDNDYNEIPC